MTSYLDTEVHSLRNRGFVLRLREEANKAYKVTLKYRGFDRYLSARQDMSTKEEGETKFEEDIIPPFTSKYSHSTSIEGNGKLPSLKRMSDIIQLFPGLKKLDFPKAKLFIVNNFEAHEIALKLFNLKFAGKKAKFKTVLSHWYLIGKSN